MARRQGQKGTLLCVDDESNILSALKRLLRRKPYKVLFAEGGEQALKVLSETPVHAILTDMRMPGIDGPTLLRKARELYPDTVRMVLTGHADLSTIMDAVNRGEIYRFITKPWTDEDILTAVDQALATYRLNEENVRLTALTTKQNEKLRALNEDLERQVLEVETLRLRLGAVLDQMADGVIVIDVAGACVVINPVARRTLSLAKRPLEPTDNVTELALGISSDDLLDHLTEAPDGMLRMTVQRAGRTYDALVTPAKDAYSPGTGAVIVLRDVTEALGLDTEDMGVSASRIRALEAPLAGLLLSLRHLADSPGNMDESQEALLAAALRHSAALDDLFDRLAARQAEPAESRSA